MDVALGYYGKTPAEVDPEVRKLAAEKSGKEPITVRPADLKDPGMDDLRKQLKEKGLPTDDEHCVIYAMFPAQVQQYHKTKDQPRPEQPTPAPASKAEPAEKPAAASTPAPASTSGSSSGEPVDGRRMKLHINGKAHDVVVEEIE
jgi:oxaloacetate decarboxylase alpha subunit/pyruvate carboxylase subunit B